MKTVYTKDGRPDGTPRVNKLEEGFSKKRYTYQLKDIPDFYEGKKVLDIGCGWGVGAKELVEQGASEVLAIDFNDEAIDLAKQKYSDDKITYVCGDLLEQDYHEGSYDVVVAVEIVEHVTYVELGDLLEKIYSLLKDDGKLYITTPHLRGKKEDYPRGSHFTEYLPHELKNIIEGFGFEQVWYSSASDNRDTGFSVIFKKVDKE